MTDPRDRRGLPENYEVQLQEPPGIQAQMKPLPDCGEAWYQGGGRLRGRRALITGGDSGIGRAVALAFARQGARVVISYLCQESEDADSLKELLEREGLQLVLLPGDIRREATSRQIVRDAIEQLGGLDVMVLNAGVQTANKKLTEVSTEQLLDTFTVNVFSPFWMVQ